MGNFKIVGDKAYFHPGYYIQELISECHYTKKKLGIENLNDLIEGKRNLTESDALKLSKVLGTSVELWLNLQKNFEEGITNE